MIAVVPRTPSVITSTSIPAAKPATAPGDRPGDETDRDDGDEQQVGLRAEDARARDRGDLQDRRDEHERRDPEREAHRSPRSAGTRTSTAWSEDRSANGSTWTCV